ncbi:hypothetical protein HK102_006287 [Quaeritorhiza haematococci]|nr:hypothetical protein HK102_006287 [Quaeritorhiza haematococci]
MENILFYEEIEALRMRLIAELGPEYVHPRSHKKVEEQTSGGLSAYEEKEEKDEIFWREIDVHENNFFEIKPLTVSKKEDKESEFGLDAPGKDGIEKGLAIGATIAPTFPYGGFSTPSPVSPADSTSSSNGSEWTRRGDILQLPPISGIDSRGSSSPMFLLDDARTFTNTPPTSASVPLRETTSPSPPDTGVLTSIVAFGEGKETEGAVAIPPAAKTAEGKRSRSSSVSSVVLPAATSAADLSTLTSSAADDQNSSPMSPSSPPDAQLTSTPPGTLDVSASTTKASPSQPSSTSQTAQPSTTSPTSPSSAIESPNPKPTSTSDNLQPSTQPRQSRSRSQSQSQPQPQHEQKPSISVPEVLVPFFQIVFTVFIEELSPLELNSLSETVRTQLMSAFEPEEGILLMGHHRKTPLAVDVFDKAQAEVVDWMFYNVYPKFLAEERLESAISLTHTTSSRGRRSFLSWLLPSRSSSSPSTRASPLRLFIRTLIFLFANYLSVRVFFFLLRRHAQKLINASRLRIIIATMRSLQSDKLVMASRTLMETVEVRKRKAVKTHNQQRDEDEDVVLVPSPVPVQLSYPCPLQMAYKSRRSRDAGADVVAVAELHMPTMDLPAGVASQELDMTIQTRVTDVRAMSEFGKLLMLEKEFKWIMKGKVDMNLLGVVKLTGLTMEKEIHSIGMNGLSDTVINFVVVKKGHTTYIEMKCGVTITNPSNIELELSDVRFALLSNTGQPLGFVQMDKMVLRKGPNKLISTGYYCPDPRSYKAVTAGKQMLSNFIMGVDTDIIITGDHQDATDVPYMVEPLRCYRLKTKLPGLKKPMIQSTTLCIDPRKLLRAFLGGFKLPSQMCLTNPLDEKVTLLGLRGRVIWNRQGHSGEVEEVVLGTMDQSFRDDPIVLGPGATVSPPHLLMLSVNLGISALNSLYDALQGELRVSVECQLDSLLGEFLVQGLEYRQSCIPCYVGLGGESREQ